MQGPISCQLCKQTAVHPIMLICSHYLCLACGQNIQIMESTSLIQNKFRIQCPKCRRITHTYEIQNLLLEAMQLNLVTDSSELDREQLHEVHLPSLHLSPQSQLCHQKNQQEAILARRQSHVYCLQNDDISKYFNKSNAVKDFDLHNFTLTPSNNLISNNTNNPTTATNNSFQRNNKPNSGSERVSPAKQNAHSKKPSFPNYYQNEESIEFYSAFYKDRESSKAMLNASLNQKNNLKVITGMSGHNTPQAQQVFLTPLASNFNFPKENNVFNQPSEKSTKNYNYTVANNQKLAFEKENDSCSKPTSQSNIRHKRSQTGIPKNNLSNPQSIQQTQQPSAPPQIQIVQSYFKMIQKNLQLLEKDMISSLGSKQVDASFIYGRLKKISQQLDGPEDELIQQVKVIVQLRQEINHAANNNNNNNNNNNHGHRKTSSNLIYQSEANSNSNTSFTNNTSMLHQYYDKTDHKVAGKQLDNSLTQERHPQKQLAPYF